MKGGLERDKTRGMGNEGEGGVKNNSKVLSLTRASGMVILLIKTGNKGEKQDRIGRC